MVVLALLIGGVLGAMLWHYFIAGPLIDEEDEIFDYDLEVELEEDELATYMDRLEKENKL